jgi:hypothetical protein
MSVLGLLFLSSEELRDLTDLKIAKAQMKWLDKNNYPYEVSASGKPKVLRSFLFDRFQKNKYHSPTTEPNFDAIR